MYNKWLESVHDEYPSHASVIKEILAMIEGRCTRLFSNEECINIIDYVCIVCDSMLVPCILSFCGL